MHFVQNNYVLKCDDAVVKICVWLVSVSSRLEVGKDHGLGYGFWYVRSREILLRSRVPFCTPPFFLGGVEQQAQSRAERKQQQLTVHTPYKPGSVRLGRGHIDEETTPSFLGDRVGSHF